MSRNISTQAKALISKQNIGVAFIQCIKLEGGGLSSPRLYTNNTIDVAYIPSDSDYSGLAGTYEAIPFDLVLPQTVDTEPPMAKLQIDNVSKEIVDELRSVTNETSLTYFLVLDGNNIGPTVTTITSSPEIFIEDLNIKNANIDPLLISVDFGSTNTIDAQFPNEGLTPNLFPGLF